MILTSFFAGLDLAAEADPPDPGADPGQGPIPEGSLGADLAAEARDEAAPGVTHQRRAEAGAEVEHPGMTRRTNPQTGRNQNPSQGLVQRVAIKTTTSVSDKTVCGGCIWAFNLPKTFTHSACLTVTPAASW